MVSDRADRRAYTELLKKVQQACVNLATDIVEGKKVVPTPGYESSLVEERCRVLSQDRLLTPAFIMIDGAKAELRAIEKVFPNTPIRMCQFHLMQACKSKARSLFGAHPDKEEISAGFLMAIRKCQRCPAPEEFEAFYNTMKAELREIAENDPRTDDFIRYMDIQWFSPIWRDKVMDYGMPFGATRDGGLSTNNFVEALFRVFDMVFLMSRSNKRYVAYQQHIAYSNPDLRLDRLIAILVNSFFPFYELSANDSMRVDPNLDYSIEQGFFLWESDSIAICPVVRLPPTLRSHFQGEAVVVYASPTTSGSRTGSGPHHCGVTAIGEREYCDCKAFEQTGKRCPHLWAMSFFGLLNARHVFQAESHRIKEAIARRQRQTARRSRKGGARGLKTEEDEFQGLTPRERDKTQEKLVDQEWEDLERDMGEAYDSLRSRTRRFVVNRGAMEVSRQVPQVTDQALRQVSPIGRRHKRARSVGSNSDSEGSASDSGLEDPDSTAIILDRHQNATAGRPKKVTPLHPERTKHKSHMKAFAKNRKRSKKDKDIRRPIGVSNTGYDCFMIALFQILARQGEWNTAFDSLQNRTRAMDEFVSFRNSLEEQTPSEFPDMRRIFFGTLSSFSTVSKLISVVP